jgi:hypothetical protein
MIHGEQLVPLVIEKERVQRFGYNIRRLLSKEQHPGRAEGRQKKNKRTSKT